MVSWSTQLPRRSAAVMPAAIPRMVARMMAQIASSSVAGKRAMNSLSTGFFEEKE